MVDNRRQKFLVARKKKRKKLIGMFVILPIIILGFTTAAFGTYFYSQIKQSVDNSYEEIEGREKSSIREETVQVDNDPFSMLIIGVDDSEKRGFGEHSRSDALLLVTTASLGVMMH